MSRDSPFCVRIRPTTLHRLCDCTTQVYNRSFGAVYGNPTSDARSCSQTNYVFHSRLDRMMSYSSRVGTDLREDSFPVRRDLVGNVSQTLFASGKHSAWLLRARDSIVTALHLGVIFSRKGTKAGNRKVCRVHWRR